MDRTLRAIRGGASERPALRLVLERSWHAARQMARNHTVPLNVAAAAGMFLSLFDDPIVALAHVDGSDDWAAQVRGYLRSVADEDRAKRARERPTEPEILSR